MRNYENYSKQFEQTTKGDYSSLPSCSQKTEIPIDFSKYQQNNLETHFDNFDFFNYNTSEQYLQLISANSIYELYKICESREVKITR